MGSADAAAGVDTVLVGAVGVAASFVGGVAVRGGDATSGFDWDQSGSSQVYSWM